MITKFPDRVGRHKALETVLLRHPLSFRGADSPGSQVPYSNLATVWLSRESIRSSNSTFNIFLFSIWFLNEVFFHIIKYTLETKISQVEF